MKFARPRNLQANTYNDLNTPQPELFHELCNKIIYPEENSDRKIHNKEHRRPESESKNKE
jgi:hypothetical protein